jgi:hypothetical protein
MLSCTDNTCSPRHGPEVGVDIYNDSVERDFVWALVGATYLLFLFLPALVDIRIAPYLRLVCSRSTLLMHPPGCWESFI